MSLRDDHIADMYNDRSKQDIVIFGSSRSIQAGTSDCTTSSDNNSIVNKIAVDRNNMMGGCLHSHAAYKVVS